MSANPSAQTTRRAVAEAKGDRCSYYDAERDACTCTFQGCWCLNEAVRQERQMALLEDVLDEYEPAFRELAKR